MICPPDNRWLVIDVGSCRLTEVTWWGDGESHREGTVLQVTHAIPHSTGTRNVDTRLPIDAVINVLLSDPETAAAVLAAVVARLGASLAAAVPT